MLIKKLLLVCVSSVTLSACSVDEMTAVNKQISDGAFALTGHCVETHRLRIQMECRF